MIVYTGLGNFLPEEQDLLIGIFYRVGFWISHIDDTDVETVSEDKEQKQMLAALNKVANSKAPELVRDIAAEAVRRSGDQARWLSREDDLLGDAGKAAQLVRMQGTVEDYNSFRKSIMFVATAVARAYREEPEHAEQEGALARLLDKAGGLLGSVTDREGQQDLNISPAEDTALHELSSALAA